MSAGLPRQGRDAVGRTLLSARNLQKSFPGQVALGGVDLDIRAGEVHALVGENGSGKSTLIKLLAGYHTPDPGSVIEISSGTRIGFVHQDLALVESMSAIDNLALGRGYAMHRGRIDQRSETKRARQLLGRLGRQVDLNAPLAQLQPVERALVAMARALDGLGDSSVLVLDEPTAALPAPEVSRLFDAVRELRSEGGGVLYVSHRLGEVFEIADRVTVLRDGLRVATVEASELDHDGLVELMLGHAMTADGPRREPAKGGRKALDVRGLSGGTVKEFSATIHSGEIVGVAGLDGSGREDLARALVGALDESRGTVSVNGTTLRTRTPRSAIEAGLALVPADRARLGLILEHSVAENITLPQLRSLVQGFRINRRREFEEVKTWINRIDIRPPRPTMPVGAMSGGNQQKSLLGRWLRAGTKVLVLDEPTQGVDVGAKESIHRLLAAAAAEGLALVVCTAETEDLVNLCDRVLVMRGGCIAIELSRSELSTNRIVRESLAPERRAMSGVSA